MFFEHKLGEGAVRDAKVVTDRVSKRSKGYVTVQWSSSAHCTLTDLFSLANRRIGYVELDALELVEKAIAISGTIVMGLPILVELTEAERNKQAPGGGPPTGMPGFGPMDPHAPMVGCVYLLALLTAIQAHALTVLLPPSPSPVPDLSLLSRCRPRRCTPVSLDRTSSSRPASCTGTDSPGPRSHTTGFTSARSTLT